MCESSSFSSTVTWPGCGSSGGNGKQMRFWRKRSNLSSVMLELLKMEDPLCKNVRDNNQLPVWWWLQHAASSSCLLLMVKVFRASLTKTNTGFNQFSVSWHKALKWFGRGNINTAHLLPLSAQDTLSHTKATTGFVSGLQPSVETGLEVTQTCSIFAPAQAQQWAL